MNPWYSRRQGQSGRKVIDVGGRHGVTWPMPPPHQSSADHRPEPWPTWSPLRSPRGPTRRQPLSPPSASRSFSGQDASHHPAARPGLGLSLPASEIGLAPTPRPDPSALGGARVPGAPPTRDPGGRTPSPRKPCASRGWGPGLPLPALFGR